MKYLMILTMMLVGCTTPQIIPDTTSDNVVMMQLKDNIQQQGPIEPSYGWVFWYVPVGILALMWGYRELIKKPIPKQCVDKKTGEIVLEEKTSTATNNQEPPKV
jgi:hypothetical protein